MYNLLVFYKPADFRECPLEPFTPQVVFHWYTYAFDYDYNVIHVTGNFIISLEILQVFVEIATTLLDMIRAESQEELLSKVRQEGSWEDT